MQFQRVSYQKVSIELLQHNTLRQYPLQPTSSECYIFAKSHHLVTSSVQNPMGWSGGAMVLDKLLVPGRPTNLDNSGTRAYCTCSITSLFFLPLSGRRSDID